MAEAGITASQNTPNFAEKPQRSARRIPPGQFPYRVTTSFAPDQIENLKLITKEFRCSENYAIRMAFDSFCRANGFRMNNGDSHG